MNDFDPKYDDRPAARQATADEKAEAQRISAELEAKNEKLAAAYSRPAARTGGPAHFARPMARR